MNIIAVVGARPNFMKIAPLLWEVGRRPEISSCLVHTGQHYDRQMSQLFFEELNIPRPDVDLGVGSGSHAVQTAEVMKRFEPIVLERRPDAVVVVGSRDKNLYALDRKTGTDVWNFLTEGRIESSPVVAGKRVYVGSLDKNLYVLDRDKGSLIQKIELDGEVVGSPAVAAGCLVLGTAKGTVYCLE